MDRVTECASFKKRHLIGVCVCVHTGICTKNIYIYIFLGNYIYKNIKYIESRFFHTAVLLKLFFGHQGKDRDFERWVVVEALSAGALMTKTATCKTANVSHETMASEVRRNGIFIISV